MTTARCPKCSRLTYSKKWGSCTADGCSLNHSVRFTVTASQPLKLRDGSVSLPLRVTKPPKAGVTKVGRPKVHVTDAERQRAYRARKKAVA